MIRNIVLSILFILCTGNIVSAQENDTTYTWPKEIENEKGLITLYQPQYESYESNILEGRMALSVKPTDGNLLFGAIWFKARLSTDYEQRTVILESITVSRVHFPDLKDEDIIERFSRFISKEIEAWNIKMSLDRFIVGMREIEDRKSLAVKLNNSPPDIYFRTSPTVLVSIDGEPKLKTEEQSKIEYVMNTPFFIVKDVKDDFYIKNGKFWYTSKNPTQDWKETKEVPSKIEEFAENSKKEDLDSLALSIKEAPSLIVVTKPSELVSTDGEPDYASIEGTSLLFASNTEDDIIMDINSQKHYILIAGRWYYSKTLENGDWKFAEPDSLPADFEKIPANSKMASVRSSVPNTTEAQDALLEQSIPQTATIDRKEAKVEVTYDGSPKFEKIENTDMSYAVNTDKTVILISNKYYCVDNAVWFVSEKAEGPWEVSTTRPDEIDNIPPESPVYNVKYVYIYESTPEVVYVGYLPGYNYSYVYGGVVVYGTGYHYNPWYGAYYYPRPVTYGYGVHYSPYSGWGFTFGISVGWGYHRYSPWGPRGYHHGYRRGYNHGYHRGYNHGYRNGARAGYRAGQHNSNNVYNNRNSGVRNTGNRQSSQNRSSTGARTSNSSKQNNMYSSRNGNVYQQNNKGGFDQKSNSRSTQSNTQQNRSSNQGSQSNRSSQQSQQQRSNNQQLNNSSRNRSSGTQSYNRSRSSGYSGGGRSGGYSGGGRSGGGRSGGRR